MKGFFGRVLRVDLRDKTYSFDEIREDQLRAHIGGRGLAVSYLLKENPPLVDPFSPENRLIFMGGPASGTQVWGSSRYGVFSKSPLTNLFGESYSGGTMARSLAAAGIDGLVLMGRSEDPVWLEINPNEVVFHQAHGIWGNDTHQTERYIMAWLEEHRPGLRFPGVASIGPAGENLVRFALIENDLWRSAGRTGMGAVMGSKRLKAVAFWGDAQKPVEEPSGIKEHVRRIYRAFKDSKVVQTYKNLGTPSMVDVLVGVAGLPSLYWTKGRPLNQKELNAEALHTEMDVRPHACLNCFLSCGRKGVIKAGPFRGLTIEGPEYETIYAFGGLCGVKTIGEIAYLNDICDRLGMDTITAGNVVALIMEAGARGRMKKVLDYGDTDSIATTLYLIANRMGYGRVLAEGTLWAAREFGIEDLAIHVKGMEPAGYDPRVLKSMALAYATSPRGACHLRSTFYKAEMMGLFDPEDLGSMVRLFVDWEDRLTIMDCMIFCRFYRDLYPWEELEEIFELLTGADGSSLPKVAKDISDEIRGFNIREGMESGADALPKRFFEEPLPETGSVLTTEEVHEMIQLYYRERGWDQEGRPQSCKGGV